MNVKLRMAAMFGLVFFCVVACLSCSALSDEPKKTSDSPKHDAVPSENTKYWLANRGLSILQSGAPNIADDLIRLYTSNSDIVDRVSLILDDLQNDRLQSVACVSMDDSTTLTMIRQKTINELGVENIAANVLCAKLWKPYAFPGEVPEDMPTSVDMVYQFEETTCIVCFRKNNQNILVPELSAIAQKSDEDWMETYGGFLQIAELDLSQMGNAIPEPSFLPKKDVPAGEEFFESTMNLFSTELKTNNFKAKYLYDMPDELLVYADAWSKNTGNGWKQRKVWSGIHRDSASGTTMNIVDLSELPSLYIGRILGNNPLAYAGMVQTSNVFQLPENYPGDRMILAKYTDSTAMLLYYFQNGEYVVASAAPIVCDDFSPLEDALSLLLQDCHDWQ